MIRVRFRMRPTEPAIEGSWPAGAEMIANLLGLRLQTREPRRPAWDFYAAGGREVDPVFVFEAETSGFETQSALRAGLLHDLESFAGAEPSGLEAELESAIREGFTPKSMRWSDGNEAPEPELLDLPTLLWLAGGTHS